ncbi:putative membrane protein [Francisella philomiragia]|nr:putative membrane protein [Francisella philomiragia]
MSLRYHFKNILLILIFTLEILAYSLFAVSIQKYFISHGSVDINNHTEILSFLESALPTSIVLVPFICFLTKKYHPKVLMIIVFIMCLIAYSLCILIYDVGIIYYFIIIMLLLLSSRDSMFILIGGFLLESRFYLVIFVIIFFIGPQLATIVISNISVLNENIFVFLLVSVIIICINITILVIIDLEIENRKEKKLRYQFFFIDIFRILNNRGFIFATINFMFSLIIIILILYLDIKSGFSTSNIYQVLIIFISVLLALYFFYYHRNIVIKGVHRSLNGLIFTVIFMLFAPFNLGVIVSITIYTIVFSLALLSFDLLYKSMDKSRFYFYMGSFYIFFRFCLFFGLLIITLINIYWILSLIVIVVAFLQRMFVYRNL